MKNDNNNGLCTSTWGSRGWFFLHCVAAGYPVDPYEYDDIHGNTRGHTRRTYSSFFKNTGHVLPCRSCRESYLAFISEIPIEKYIDSRQKLFEWLFIIHNKVNEKISAKQEASLRNIVNKYERFRATWHYRKSLGWTAPAKKNTKTKSTLVVEPVRRRRKRHLVICAVVLMTALYMYISRLRSRNYCLPQLRSCGGGRC